jgi:hypothetical protein
MISVCAYAVAISIGALVGVVELFQRYRAEPLPALTNRWGIGYVLFNASAAAFALFIAIQADSLGAHTSTLDWLRWAAAAGAGAAAMLRSKLFSIRLSEGEERAVGPEIVLQSLLAVVDRELDRYRGLRRYEAVHQLFDRIDFDRAKLRLTTQLFSALQHITEDDSQRVLARIGEIERMTALAAQDKAYLLGYQLLDLAGEPFLRSVLEKHHDDFS